MENSVWNTTTDLSENKETPACEPEQYETSLTQLGNLQGNSDMVDEAVYGAQYMATDIKTPYYERRVSDILDAPWIGQSMEATYMNRTKELNEKIPDLNFKIQSIPTDQYETIEGFGENTKNLVFKILCAVFLVVLIYYLCKQIQ